MTIDDLTALRQCYPLPLERAMLKSLSTLDAHMRRFIALSPFLCMGSSGADGIDVTPRGDQPGFVHVQDESTLLIPDWPGNNRLDSLSNIVSNPSVGLIFFIPGVDETLRVNGVAAITVEPAIVQRWTVNGRSPRSALVLSVREAYLHCAKALIRSRLWSADHRVDRAELPSLGQMLKDQIATDQTAEEIQASVVEGYKSRLY